MRPRTQSLGLRTAFIRRLPQLTCYLRVLSANHIAVVEATSQVYAHLCVPVRMRRPSHSRGLGLKVGRTNGQFVRHTFSCYKMIFRVPLIYSLIIIILGPGTLREVKAIQGELEREMERSCCPRYVEPQKTFRFTTPLLHDRTFLIL